MASKKSRGAAGGGTIRQRADGRWEARITVGRNPATGKQIQKSIYGATQREVRQKLQRAALEIDEGTYTAPSRTTVAEWMQTWLAEYIGNVKPHTVHSYEVQVRTHVVPALGAVALSSLTAPMIQRFYNNMSKNGLSPKTVKNVHGVLHRALAQAVAIGILRSNPSDVCKLPRVERREIQPLDEEAISAFLQVLRGHPFETLYKVDLFTGMRQAELLGLTWDCVDFKRGTIRIYRQLQKSKTKGEGYYFAPLKNNKSRTITPAPTVMDLLQAHRKHQLQNRIRVGSKWDDEGFGDLVFTNEFGRHLVHGTVSRQFKLLITQSGIPTARFHDLRHSYAVAALQSGDDVKTVQENLGHHTAAFTLDVYGHVTERMKRESAERMERFIQGVGISKGSK